MNKVQLHKQITPDEALKRAKEYGLTKEVKDELDHGQHHGKHFMNGIY